MPNSALFWAVLVVTVAVHWGLPQRWRPWFLAASSFAYILYVAWRTSPQGAPVDVRLGAVALLVLAVACYLVSQRLHARPTSLVVGLVAALLAYLAYYKYLPSIYRAILSRGSEAGAVSVAVPLGASYFTFKLIHYLVESGRRRVNADGSESPNIPPHGWGTFLSYVFFFPTFTAGPIERFDTSNKESGPHALGWLRSRAASLRDVRWVEATTRIIYGLVKKFVVADLILGRTNVLLQQPPWTDGLPLWSPPLPLDQLLQDLHNLSPLFAWQYVINQFLVTYVDFSAYSDVAIGCALLFGVRVMENFRWPIFATDIADFWKRWHISLSSWCQQYVYLPMIGWTRNPYMAVYATQVAIGVWHVGNVNYLSWGAYHGTLMVTYLTWSRVKRRRRWRLTRSPFVVVGTLLTFLSVAAGHAFVATSHLGMRSAIRLFVKLFGVDVLGAGSS